MNYPSPTSSPARGRTLLCQRTHDTYALKHETRKQRQEAPQDEVTVYFCVLTLS